jgi:hypothetical protein
MQFRATPLPPSPHTVAAPRRTVWRRRQIRVGVVAAATLLVAALPVTACAPGKGSASTGQTGPSTAATQPATTGPLAQPSGPTSPLPDPYATGPNGLPVHLASAWLAADQYPFFSSYHWVISGIEDGTQEPQVDYACQNRDSLHDLGMRSLQIRSAINNGTSTMGGYQGVEELFFFSDSTTASNTYSAILGDMTGCQARETGYAAQKNPVPHVAVTQTATIEAGSAWSRVVTARVHIDDNLEDHDLILQRGRVVAIVQLYWNRGAHPTYDTVGDTAVLHQMAAQLCQYGGSC